MSDTTDFFVSNQCTPAIRTNIATAGLMTACRAHIPAPSELETLYKDSDDYRLMEALFLWQWEANANQAVQSNLFKFFQANRVNLRGKVVTERLNAGLMAIRPYVQVKRKGPINNNFWKAASGAACDVDGSLNGSGIYWRMDFSSPTGIPVHAGWFNAKEWVFVVGLDGSGNSIHWAGEVVSSSVVSTVVRVVLKPQMTNSSLPSARKANPTQGGATRGAPNVDNFESFCAQPPGLITTTLDPFWIGTTRTTFKEDELYNKWRDLVLADNVLYREIFDLPTQEYNKQVAEDFARKHVESMFNNTALANQTVEAAENLETINSSADGIGGARCIGKRANPIGIYEQHVQCERVVDAQGTKLNLPALFQALNKMMRIREASGAAAAAQKTFEIAMPSNYMPLFHQGMLAYYNTQWAGKVQWTNEVKQDAKVSPMGFLYMDYPLLWPVGVTIRILTDTYFDDYAAFMHELAVAFSEPNYDNLGRRLWIADWSRIYMGLLGSKRISNNPGSDLAGMQRLGIIDPCIMETIREMNTLTSFTWTVVADCTPGNLILENLSAEVPEHDVIGSVNYDENS